MLTQICQIALGAFLGGIVFSVLDRAYGRKIYRAYHNFTSGEQLSPDVELGIVTGQHASHRLTVAVVVAFVYTWLAYGLHASALPETVASLFVEVPLMMAGFYVGPLVNRIWERRKVITDVVDDFESGKRTIKGELGHVAQNARAAVIPIRPLPKKAEASPTTTNPAPEEPKIDAREAIRKFTDGR